MKHIIHSFTAFGALALLAFAVGCASTKSTENRLMAAGFKVITPSTPEQHAKLQTLPANKVTMIQHEAKTYYVFPDQAHNQAYIGGPQQFAAYQALCAEQRIASENLQAAELNQDPGFGWGAWGGWGRWGGYGGMGGPGWY
jgi:hypothetical protein